MVDEIDLENERNSQGLVTLTLDHQAHHCVSLIDLGSPGTPLCITHRPPPTHQTSLEPDKHLQTSLCTDGHKDRRMDGRPALLCRLSQNRSQPNKAGIFRHDLASHDANLETWAWNRELCLCSSV